MNLRRLLDSSLGKIIISILLGLGLASLFYNVCNSKNCIVFKGPILSEIDGKIIRYGDSCYKYDLVPTQCNSNKKIVELDKKT
jgi:hypothetical protein|tara:strand:+ start:493 stop:741 length:249 start_codon:yes stop_codon:yes gene_type:complete